MAPSQKAMVVCEDFKTFVIDQLSGFGPVSIRRMFGGAGVYHQGLMFALISNDTLYFKADASSQPTFKEEHGTVCLWEGR